MSPPILRASRGGTSQADPLASQGSQFAGFGTLQRAEDLLSPMQKQVAGWSQESSQKVRGTLLSTAAASAFRQGATSTTRPGTGPTTRSHGRSRFVVPKKIAGSLTPEQRTRWSRHWALAKRKKSETQTLQSVSAPTTGAWSAPSSGAWSVPSSTAPPTGARAGPSGMASLSSTLPRPRLMPMPVPKNLKVNA